MVREARSHRDEVSRDLNRVLECHSRVITAAAQRAVGDAELPNDIAQPLLGDTQLSGLGLGAVEVCGECVGKLLL